MSDIEPIRIKLPDLTPLHTVVGQGITAFATVEFAVGMTFAAMLEPAPHKVSVAAINAARSFEAKKKIVDATAEARLEGPALRKWRNLSSKIGKRQDFRHKLAHWMVTHYPAMKTVGDIKNAKPALVPPFWSAAHARLYWGDKHNLEVRPISLKEINLFIEGCNTLAMELLRFAETMRRRRKTRRKDTA